MNEVDCERLLHNHDYKIKKDDWMFQLLNSMFGIEDRDWNIDSIKQKISNSQDEFVSIVEGLTEKLNDEQKLVFANLFEKGKSVNEISEQYSMSIKKVVGVIESILQYSRHPSHAKLFIKYLAN